MASLARKLNSARMFRSSIGALVLSGALLLTCAGASGVAANSSQTDNAKESLRRIIGSPAKNRFESLSVVAGTRMCDQFGPVHDRNVHPAPTAVAPGLRWLVTETVNFAEIVDHLLIHAVQV